MGSDQDLYPPVGQQAAGRPQGEPIAGDGTTALQLETRRLREQLAEQTQKHEELHAAFVMLSELWSQQAPRTDMAAMGDLEGTAKRLRKTIGDLVARVQDLEARVSAIEQDSGIVSPSKTLKAAVDRGRSRPDLPGPSALPNAANRLRAWLQNLSLARGLSYEQHGVLTYGIDWEDAARFVVTGEES